MSKFRLSCVLAVTLCASSALAGPKAFETPEAAVNAVVDALRAHDRDAVLAIFGPENEDVIATGDPERDSEDREDFLAAYDEMHRVATNEDGVATLYVGRNQWPFPLRLAKGDAGWAFDVEGGREEMQDRRIGRNELDVIDLMRAYVRVQFRFRQSDYDEDGIMEFAPSFLSSPGKRDGLYWPPDLGEPESPVSDVVAEATAEGYVLRGTDEAPKPYLGYYFQILDKQGQTAPGGAMDYMVNGNMMVGHALLAFPADYGDTGIMSFMVAENGIVYEADLGENTIDLASDIDSFDPAPPWEPVDDED